MALPDTSKRLRDEVIKQDITALRGARGFTDYTPTRPEASVENLSAMERKLQELYDREVQMQAQLKAFLDEVRLAEWEFHQAIQAMKTAVLAQYGKNSNQAEAVGYKKQEDYKRPTRNNNKNDKNNNDKNNNDDGSKSS